MKLSSYLTTKHILIDLEASSIEEAIVKTIETLAEKIDKVKEDCEKIKTALILREDQSSTAIGEGIVVPHGRIKDFNDFIVVIVTFKEPFSMKVIGKKEEDLVKLAVFIISDSINDEMILKVMANFARMAKKFPETILEIKNATRPSQILKIIDKTSIELGHDLVAEDLMHNDIVPINPTLLLAEVEKRMITEKMEGFPVVDEEGKFIGEVSEKSLIGYGVPKVANLEDMDSLIIGNKPFKEYFKDRKLVTAQEVAKYEERAVISKETPIMNICFLIANMGYSRLYVVEDGKYIGIIESFDILRKIKEYNSF